MLEQQLGNREVIKNPVRGTVESGEIMYGTLDDLLPSFLHSMARLPLVLNRLERRLRRKKKRSAGQSGPGDYISIKEAAVITSLSDTHIRRAVKSGDLPASNNGSGSHPIYRIARSDLADWMNKKKGGNVKVPPRSELKNLVNRYFGD